ncbi:MAG: tetratricopeptide repeat protein [Gemmatimonadota bacterium]|nr:tetratricopeptide repeat protein [Gemmatimonadota bacterium]
MRFIGLIAAAIGIATPASGQDIVEAVLRGDSLWARGQPKQAIAEYEKARELGAGSAMFLNRLAGLYMQTGGYSQAAESLQQSLAEDPRQLPVYLALGEAFWAMGQLDSSIFYVEQASILAPDSTKVHSSLGYLYIQDGQRERARERIDRALLLDDKNLEAYRLYGLYYAQQDSVDRAIEYYQKLAELSPDNVEAYNNIAFLLAGVGRYPEALEYYELAKDQAQNSNLAQAITAKIEEVQALLAGEMRARYILVETEASALEVLEKMAQGADFSQLAQRLSIAPNANQGGDLGFFGPGELMPEIEEIVVQLKVGELSQVVELPMGYIVVQRLN